MSGCRKTRRKPTKALVRIRAERNRALQALETLGAQFDLVARIVANIVLDIKRGYPAGVSYEDYLHPLARLTGRKALDFGPASAGWRGGR